MEESPGREPTTPAPSMDTPPATCDAFMNLPLEIRRKIYRFAIEPAKISFYHKDVVRPPSSNALTQVCRESRTEYLQVRRLKWIRCVRKDMNESPEDFREGYAKYEMAADIVNDLLVVWWNQLPRLAISKKYTKTATKKEFGDESACGFARCLNEVPIQRLLNAHHTLEYVWDNERYSGSGWFTGVPMVDNILDLRRFPSLREYYSTYEVCGSDWWLTGYQVHGPHVTSNILPPGNRWSMESGDSLHESSKHFKSKSIVGDTGILWKGRETRCSSPQNSLFFDRAMKTGDATVEDLPREDLTPKNGPLEDLTPEELAFEHFKNQKRKKLNEINTLYTPFIGFRGYSETPTSLGGHWAGFRYFTETGRVEFSPMSWDEVNRHGLGVPEGGPLPRDFPEMVVKVYIVRPSDAPPQQTHHFWQKVPTETDLLDEERPDMKKIRRIWDIVSFEFNGLGHFDWEGYGYDPQDENFREALDLEKPIESDYTDKSNDVRIIENLKLYTSAEIAEEISAGPR